MKVLMKFTRMQVVDELFQLARYTDKKVKISKPFPIVNDEL